jgi:ABC-type Zn uptake system ZnuABC Zn-binding protein ZnuA
MKRIKVVLGRINPSCPNKRGRLKIRKIAFILPRKYEHTNEHSWYDLENYFIYMMATKKYKSKLRPFMPKPGEKIIELSTTDLADLEKMEIKDKKFKKLIKSLERRENCEVIIFDRQPWDERIDNETGTAHKYFPWVICKDRARYTRRLAVYLKKLDKKSRERGGKKC